MIQRVLIVSWKPDQCSCISTASLLWSLQWRHNDHDGVWNHQPYDCLLNRLFRRRWKETSKLRITGLCAGNSPVHSPHKGPVTWKMFPFDDALMCMQYQYIQDCIIQWTIIIAWSILTLHSKLLNKQSSGQWLKTPWCSCNVLVMKDNSLAADRELDTVGVTKKCVAWLN